MKLQRVIPYSHTLLSQSVQPGDFVVDGTAGNGHDTLMLANLVEEEGHVLAFDIQQQAIENTKALLKENRVNNVTLIQESHESLENHLPEKMNKNISGAIFNLGYLPGSDKSIITKPSSTIKAIDTLLRHLRVGKLIILVVYYGHEGGLEEKNKVMDYLKDLDQKYFSVLQYGFLNQKNNPPFILAIERTRG
ncbi:tRNA G37 N-methylase Trm5 [Salirhabdus euzebyi]|uniref:tRNA G37 N-methylase Trm5 n=1 Tax=Salirhabdus euzebyi TaxID=394506 RepID=A0A841QA85_9BACI|nr:class I SAM-dependent methyltransferase [Salirhabdus euzebyi]MBB6455431.1 tRNA G37 N-methylase Trm5 [Salirhabdus euzebyi]